MTTLREAAQQALEALEDVDGPITALLGSLLGSPDADAPGAKVRTAITALRAALAQQAEPLNLRDPAVQKRLATQWGYVPAAQQAEPVEPVVWDVTKNGRLIYDYDFTHDAVLRVMGDFEDDEQRVRYAQRIVDKLNAAPAQQAEPVGKTCTYKCEAWPECGCAPPKAEPVAAAAAVVATQSDVWRGYNGQWAPPGEPIKMVQMLRDLPMGTPLYTALPQRKPLTEEEMRKCAGAMDAEPLAEGWPELIKFARAVERAHGIKG